MSGKYDDLSQAIQRATGAEGVLLFVKNGNKGNGMSVTGGLLFQLLLASMLKTLIPAVEALQKEVMKDCLKKLAAEHPEMFEVIKLMDEDTLAQWLVDYETSLLKTSPLPNAPPPV